MSFKKERKTEKGENKLLEITSEKNIARITTENNIQKRKAIKVLEFSERRKGNKRRSLDMLI